MIAQLAAINPAARHPSLWPVCYWTVIALLLAGAVWQRFKLPLDRFADPDTWGYLSPALRKLTGAELVTPTAVTLFIPASSFWFCAFLGRFGRSPSPNIYSDFWPVQFFYTLGSGHRFSCQIRGSVVLVMICSGLGGAAVVLLHGRRLLLSKQFGPRASAPSL